VGLRAGLDAVVKRKIPSPYWDSNHRSAASSLAGGEWSPQRCRHCAAWGIVPSKWDVGWVPEPVCRQCFCRESHFGPPAPSQPLQGSALLDHNTTLIKTMK
jgi:hypothetical protein